MAPAKDQEAVQIGCQGWNYQDWVTAAASAKSIFYPRNTRGAEMLDIYARVFQTIEVDSTFYAVPPASAFDGWRKRTPSGFTFSLKLPQEITHRSALRGREAVDTLTEFCDRARDGLGSKLASVLIQLPPQFAPTPENFRALGDFLALLPRDVRFSVEFRDNGWFNESVIELLSRYSVALALVEGEWIAHERVWRYADRTTADFAYVRFMGARDLTRFDRVVRPQDENLQTWSEVIEQLSKRVPQVYVYFSNFYEGHAPASANKLKGLLHQAVTNPDDLENQLSLF